jgi:hypothetical protein
MLACGYSDCIEGATKNAATFREVLANALLVCAMSGLFCLLAGLLDAIAESEPVAFFPAIPPRGRSPVHDVMRRFFGADSFVAANMVR